MRMLVVASAISQAWIALAYDCLDSGPTVVVDFDDAIHAQLKSIGISSIPIRVPGDSSWAQRDTDFAKLALPGSLTEPFPLTDLPMWKVLSLDRLSFWYRGRQARLEYEAVMGLDWDSALVPLSLHNPLPWRIAREKPTMAVQTELLRTRAWLDWLSKPMPFTRVFLTSQKDVDFVKPYYRGEIHLVESSDFPPGQPVSAVERSQSRKLLGIGDGERVGLVLFESQTEWEFRSVLADLVNYYQRVLIYPVNDYDRRNLTDLGIVSVGPIRIVDSIVFEAAADEVILGRYHEPLIRSRRVPVRVLDITNRWESKRLA